MILVTGGSGFIGAHLVTELLAQGEKVRVFDSNPFPASVSTQPTDTVVGDILDRTALNAAAADCHTVFHLAGNAHLWARNPDVFERVNFRGTENVIAACRKNRIKHLVFTGTESILIPAHINGVITEDVEPKLKDMPGPYCRSKLLAEQAVFRACGPDLAALVVCPTLPIGPGDRNFTPPGQMISDFLSGKIPAYMQCRLNFIDVRDAALGHVLAAKRGVPGRRYILSGHTVTLRAFFEQLSRITGKPAPRFRIPHHAALFFGYLEEWIGGITGRKPRSSVTGIKLCGHRAVFDGSRTWGRLGHTPRPLAESIADAVTWQRDQYLLK